MLHRLYVENLDEIYKIMKDSFPVDERRPYEKQKALFDNEAFKIYGLIDEKNGNIKAFITMYEYDRIIFIEHFAVSSKYRNHGLGAVILREILDCGNKMLCLEVEPPTTDIANRRIEFYKRNGFYFNNYYYVQPALGNGQEAIELKIMTTKKMVSYEEFNKIRKWLYRVIYKCEEKICE